MAYRIDCEDRGTYLYVLVTGTNTREAVLGYHQDVLAECRQREVSRVLIDERLEGERLSTFDVFDIASQGSRSAFAQFSAIAYVEAQMTDLREFAEDIAVNRGIPVATFTNLEDAERWIEAQAAGADEVGIFTGEDRLEQ